MELAKLRPEIAQAVEEVAKDHLFIKPKITHIQTNQKGEGYLGEIFMISILDEASGKKLEIVVKAAFNDEKIRQSVPIRMSFLNEINFYAVALKQFQDFIPEDKHFLEFTPKCFKVSRKDAMEMLVLENLKTVGFETFSKKAELDHNHVKLIFETYGEFHAISMAMRLKQPEDYAKIVSTFENVYVEFLKTTFFQKHFRDLSKSILDKLVEGEHNELIEKFQKYMDRDVIESFRDSVASEIEHPAIVHGDCWSNNMLFKYENNNSDDNGTKTPTDIRLIDWQLLKVGSPVCDLSYCLYSGASKEVFQNLDQYLRYYYEKFSATARSLQCDPAQLYPFEALQNDWKKYARFGFLMGISIWRMKLTHNEDLIDLTDVVDFSDANLEFFNAKFDEDRYYELMVAMVQHLCDAGVF